MQMPSVVHTRRRACLQESSDGGIHRK